MSHDTTVTLEPSDWELLVELLKAELALLDRASEQADDEIDSREWTKWSVLARQYRRVLENIEAQLLQGWTVTGDEQGWTMISALIETEAGKQQMVSLFGAPAGGSAGITDGQTRRQSRLQALLERFSRHLDAQSSRSGWQ